MKKIKVSIIIPCYNASEYIDKCLKSILDDKLDNKELILINDGSKDNTLSILKKYQKEYNNIIIIDQKNSGQAVARNKGLKIVSGEYISFVDIDDYVKPNIFYKMYNFAKKNNCDYVYCDFINHYKRYDKIVINHHNDDLKKDKVLANFAPWGKLISKKLIDKYNFKFLEGKIFEDIAVIPFIGAMSKNPGYFNEALYVYNLTNLNSTTRQKKYNPKFNDIIYVSDYIYNLFDSNNLINKYYEELSYIYMDSILKSGVLQFCKYKEGLKQIPILRKNVKSKFNNLLSNKYYKKEKLYRKFTALISIYFPPIILYLMKKVKR